MKALNKSKKGFTLIELLIVVVIIGILAAIAIPNFISMVAKAKDASIKSNMHTIQAAAEEMSTICDGHYPLDCGITVNDIRNDLGLSQLPNCAAGGEGDKSIAGAAQGVNIGAGVCTFLPSTYRNPVLGAPNLAWFSDAMFTNVNPPPNNNWFGVIATQNAGCVHYIPWDNAIGGGGATANSVPAYAIAGENSKGGDIGLYLVTGQ